MKPAIQTDQHRCDCGQDAPVVRVTAFEFSWRCACQAAGVLAWSHTNNPPKWTPQPMGQLEMFR